MAVTERIICEVFRPNKDLILKHQVTFGRKAFDGTRKSPVSAFTYNTNKYTNCSELTQYTVDTEDYLILERNYYDKSRDSVKILMSYQHIFKMKNALRDALKWFYDDEYNDVFLLVDERLMVNIEHPVEASAFNLVGGSAIVIRPHVIEIETEVYEGVVMFFNSEECSTYLTIDQLEALKDFMDSFRLYEASRLLFNSQQLIFPTLEIEQKKATSNSGSSFNKAPMSKNLPVSKRTVVSNEFDF